MTPLHTYPEPVAEVPQRVPPGYPEPPCEGQSVDDSPGPWSLDTCAHALHLEEAPVELQHIVPDDDRVLHHRRDLGDMLCELTHPSDIVISYAVHLCGLGWDSHSRIDQRLQVDVAAIRVAAD
ncbi:uncharacterized protein METZ01_LOCUS125137 [marine metagenome]|uniref:Uncharacterized protein n=1 Tax=marine metagenome TaxID=408172 RepID=A0A381Y719_9ZZZZ